MAANRDARGSVPDNNKAPAPGEQRLLWNPENVKDVAESVGIGSLGDEALRTLSQDVEYRIGQVIVEALRFMRAAKRTTMTVQDISQALRVLDVEPLYGYDSTRPLRYGEASLGPGQPLFYIEDEEVDFEKLINAPLPKVPRDTNFTAHWLAIEGVQPSIPQNPTTSESRTQDLLPKGPGANPTLAAIAGNENANFKPSVKHVISKELSLYFEKVQAALLDESTDAEVGSLRRAALESVSSDPGIHQLVPYFVNFISHQVTHCLEDIFVLRQMMELTGALVSNEHIFLDPYASPLSASVLTCLMGRKLGPASADAANTNPAQLLKDQYSLRELAASLIGQIARKYSASNKLLRPKLVRSCLRSILDPVAPPAVWYGATSGFLAAGGPEAVQVLLLPNIRDVDASMLAPLKEKAAQGTEPAKTDFEAVVGALVKAMRSMAQDGGEMEGLLGKKQQNGVNGNGGGSPISEKDTQELKHFIGDTLTERLVRLGDPKTVAAVLDARHYS